MKKTFAAMIALAAVALTGCIGDGQNQGETSDNDSTAVETAEQADTALQQVTGVAVDGAMNSVILKVGDDTMIFAYPELELAKRASWTIDDTVTVRYYETPSGDDSVTQVILGSVS